MIKQNLLTFEEIKKNVNDAGNLFYQYRACRRDFTTIYDIENIRHGQVYARTPLQMNDPFDSMIGFSADKIYDECIDLILSQVKSLDENIKVVVKNILKYKLAGKTIEFIDALNKLRKYLFKQSVISHVKPANFTQFVVGNIEKLYKKCPSDTKKYFNKQLFLFFSIFIKDYKNIEIKEKTIIDILNMEDSLNLLEKNVVEIRDQRYLPAIKDFLSKLTVVCFSASGWNNQLMWSHYANSYSGICVEYDFEKMDEFIGFMCPVKYSTERPTISLRDLGFDKFETDETGKLKTSETDMSVFLSYLLVKHKCWEYEDEWRIINIGKQPYTPMFINVPFIKSITLGLNLDEMCKQLIWDVCQETGIDCYQLVINPSDYHLGRKKLTEESMPFNEFKEAAYIDLISHHISSTTEKLTENSKAVISACEKGSFELNATLNSLTSALDFLSDAYFLKLSLHRFCKHMKEQELIIKENQEISLAVSQIDMAISASQSLSESMKISLLSLLTTHKILNSDYLATTKLLENIHELVDKHHALKWFPDTI